MIKPNSIFTVNYISNVQKTYEFWKSLGVEVVKKEEDKVVINLAGLELHYILETTEPYDDYQFATKISGRGQGTLFYFEVNDIEKFFNIVKKQNPKIITDIKSNHWGAKEFMFSDSDGYLFVAYVQ